MTVKVTTLREGREVACGRIETSESPGGNCASRFWERLGATETLTCDQLQPSGYAGYVVECLEAAAWCCLHSNTLEGALVQAVNLSGEADTIAAVAGAFWGADSIPQRWLDKLYRRADLERIAQELAALRRRS